METEGTDTPLPPATGETPTIALMLQMQQQQQQQIQQQMQQQMAMQQQMVHLMSKLVPPCNAHENQEPPTHINRSNRAKIERPRIDADCTDNQWVIFCDAWNRYKQMSSLSKDTEIRNELRSSCSPKVNEMLFNFVGPADLDNAGEQELMKHIKGAAVRVVHTEVYHQQFFTLKQSDGESITNFVSRLKAQAMLCDFTCQNQTCTTAYSPDMVKSQLIAGTHNPSHQSKVLSEMEVLKTLDQVINRLLALESTERAATHFRSPFSPLPPSNDIAPITHDRKKQFSSKQDQLKQQQCAECGKSHHAKGRSSCPAWQKTCNKCKKLNHFANVCRSSSINASVQEDEPYELSTIDIAPL